MIARFLSIVLALIAFATGLPAAVMVWTVDGHTEVLTQLTYVCLAAVLLLVAVDVRNRRAGAR